MSLLCRALLAATALSLSIPALAQERGPGWEFGGDLLYQDAQDSSFEGGSSIDTQTNWGFSLFGGYRFNSRLEVQFALDWQDIDYDATLASQAIPGTAIGIESSLEAFTPRVVLNYNFMEGPITPYVTGAVGWTFIDTNVPNGLPQNYCWFDPWWGPVCFQEQPTKSIDDFVYNLGIGARWDFQGDYSIRFAYERHWIDFQHANSTPGFDQLKLGFSVSF